MTWRTALVAAVLCSAGFAPVGRIPPSSIRNDALALRENADLGISAAAEMTRVPQFDNDRAASWRSVIPPHSESTLHRHDRFRTVIGIAGGDLTTVSADGRKTVTRYETGKAYWQPPMPPGEMHKDVNETGRTIELVVVEMK